jgi:regulator of PEP synthase PpsR (kinase-PPPase family)
MTMAASIKHVFVVSDATGQTCERVAKAALAQFEDLEAELRMRKFVRTPQEVEKTLREAKELGAVVVYTLVGAEERNTMAAKSRELGVHAIDVLGPLLAKFAELSGHDPAEIPGLYQDLIDGH